MTSLVYDGPRMAREPKRLTKAMLDGLRRKAQADSGFNSFVADAGQPGLYAWARGAIYAGPGLGTPMTSLASRAG